MRARLPDFNHVFYRGTIFSLFAYQQDLQERVPLKKFRTFIIQLSSLSQPEPFLKIAPQAQDIDYFQLHEKIQQSL